MTETTQTEQATGTPEPRAEQAPRAEGRTARRAVAAKKPPRRRGVVVTDPVADMLTRVRNAVRARHDSVELPASRIREQIARILKAEGYISDLERSAEKLVIRLKYEGRASALIGLRRISRPGLRVYRRRREMPRVLGGLGVAIVSTSAGVMTGREAQRRGLGGEILAEIW